MSGQDYSSTLNSSAMTASEMNSEEPNSSSSFLRIQSPGVNNSNNLVNQHKNSANVSNFVDAYESLPKPSHSMPHNSVPFDTLFQQHTSTVSYVKRFSVK